MKLKIMFIVFKKTTEKDIDNKLKIMLRIKIRLNLSYKDEKC